VKLRSFLPLAVSAALALQSCSGADGRSLTSLPSGTPSIVRTATANETRVQNMTTTATPARIQLPQRAISNPPQPTRTPYPTYSASQTTPRPTPLPQHCRAPDPAYAPPFTLSDEDLPAAVVRKIIQALNDGASYEVIIAAIPGPEESYFDPPLLRDLTGDTFPELVITHANYVLVTGCLDNQYQSLLSWYGGYWPELEFIGDMNNNGIPELVLTDEESTGWNTTVDLFEWNDDSFVNLIKACHGIFDPIQMSVLAEALYWYETNWLAFEPSDYCHEGPWMNGLATVDIRDLDGNGTRELIVTDHGPQHWDALFSFGPWRGRTVVFQWDGLHFLYSSLEIDPPEFRFQAVQDADRKFLLGDYDAALRLYQEAIFSNDLRSWTPSLHQYSWDLFFYQQEGGTPPTPPPPDPKEYPSLAAYARYRILLHHISRGWLSDAKTVLNSLRAKYPSDSPGGPCVEAGNLLWTTYQSQKDLPLACAKVIQYFRDHTALLDPLGNAPEHGNQSHQYTPEDTCPFR
jgi:hypothetical protein